VRLPGLLAIAVGSQITKFFWSDLLMPTIDGLNSDEWSLVEVIYNRNLKKRISRIKMFKHKKSVERRL